MIRAGLVGLGRMGLTHLAILNDHPDLKITAACDTSSLVAGQVEKQIGIKAYSDWKKMLGNEQLDAVLVATPPALHDSVIDEVVGKRLHMFVEKPLTLDAATSNRLADASEKSELVTQVGYVNRFNEVFREVRRLVSDGVLGRVIHFNCQMNGRTVLQDTSSGWRGKKKEGGGCRFEFATHCVDLALFIFGMPQIVAGSHITSVYSANVDDAVYSTFVYDDDKSGHISVNWSDASYRKPTNILEVVGTHGRLVANKHEYRLFAREPVAGFDSGWNVRYLTDIAKPVRFYLRGNEFTLQLDHFVESVVKRQTTDCSFREGSNTDSILAMIAEDARGDAT